jgi:hypothetical protein
MFIMNVGFVDLLRVVGCFDGIYTIFCQSLLFWWCRSCCIAIVGRFMRAKASTSSSPTMNTSHFGILINGLQSGKTLPSMFLGTCKMFICDVESIDYYLDVCAMPTGYPFNVTEVPSELLYGVRFLRFRWELQGGFRKTCCADSVSHAQQPCMMRTGCCGNQKKSTSPRRFFCQMAALSSRWPAARRNGDVELTDLLQ